MIELLTRVHKNRHRGLRRRRALQRRPYQPRLSRRLARTAPGPGRPLHTRGGGPGPSLAGVTDARLRRDGHLAAAKSLAPHHI
jgi:hypothetical protein